MSKKEKEAGIQTNTLYIVSNLKIGTFVRPFGHETLPN